MTLPIVRYERRISFRENHPLARVVLRGTKPPFGMDALMDTGADVCVFPVDAAVAAGIDLTNARKVSLGAANGIVEGSLIPQCDLTVEGKRLQVPIIFCSPGPSYPLLGRDGVFSAIQFGLRERLAEYYLRFDS